MAARPARRRGVAGEGRPRFSAAAPMHGPPRRGGGQNLMRAPVAAMVMSSVGVLGISALKTPQTA